MKYLDEIKNKDIEVKTFIKENLDNEDFITTVVDYKDEMVPILLSHKILPDEIIEKICTNTENAHFLVDSFINEGYTPSPSFFEMLIKLGEGSDEALKKTLENFSSMPVDMQLLMRLFNEGFNLSAVQVLKQHPELRKNEALLLSLSFKEIEDEDFFSMLIENETVVSDLVHRINKKEQFQKKLVSKMVLTHEDLKLDFDLIINHPLTTDALDKVLSEQPKKSYSNSWNRGYYHRRSSNDQRGNYRSKKSYDHKMEWRKQLEEIEGMDSDILVVNAPEGSKHRLRWIGYQPSEATAEELISLFNENFYLCNIDTVKALIKLPLDQIKKVRLQGLSELISPTNLADSLSSKDDLETTLTFLNEMPSKYRQALRKIVPADQIPEEQKRRKKSYFVEALQGIKNNDISEFRDAVSQTGYPIEKFMEDTHQSSKQVSCENTRIQEDFLLKLTKDELLHFMTSHFSLPTYGLTNEDGSSKLSYKLTAKEAEESMEKFDEIYAYAICGEKVKFLNSSKLEEGNLSQIFEYYRDEIFNDEDLLKTYLSRAKGLKLEMSDESVRKLAKILTKEELLSFIEVKDYYEESYIDIQTKDGKFLYTEEDLISLVGKQHTLERVEFIEKVSQRNPDLAIKIVNAYLEGNKALTSLVGEKVSIRRNKDNMKKFNKMLLNLQQDEESIVNECFKNGGSLDDFKSKLLNWKKSLSKYGDNRELKIDRASYDQLDDFLELKNIKVKIQTLSLDRGYYHYYEEDISPGNVSIEKVEIGENSRKEALKLAKIIMEAFGVEELTISEEMENSNKLDLIIAGVYFEGSQEILNRFLAGNPDLLDECDYEQLRFLEEKGLMVSAEVVERFLNEAKRDDEIAKWLVERVGSLEGNVMSEDDYFDEEAIKILISSGLKVIPDDEFTLLQIKEKLKKEGKDFSVINVEDLNVRVKLNLIKFIEQEIDSNYSSLNLTSINLDTLEAICSYKTMRAMYSLDLEDISSLLNVPNNIKTNKKIMKGLQEIIAAKGAGLIQKTEAMKRAFSILNSKVELELSDFLDYSNPKDVVYSNNLEVIEYSVLKEVENYREDLLSQKIVLKDKPKAALFRFLRSSSEKGDSYIRDILQSIQAITNGIEGLKERLVALKELELDDNDQQITDLQEAINNIEYRLHEVAQMEDAVHMHDRLVPLMSFLESDPLQPLGQDKYRKLENSKKVEEDIGYQLFFPRTRGDLVDIGSEHGWCVNYSRHYGDDVIKKGNILFCLCEKGKESAKENVIALGHFINNGNGDFRLEQLRWSKHKKEGRTNVDATGSFSHGKIKAMVINHLNKRGK